MPNGFLRSWVATHVKPVPEQERSGQIAKWAAECVADALMAGIPYDNLQEAAGGNVMTYIAKVADDVAERLSEPIR
jgi:hypothetical protein